MSVEIKYLAEKVHVYRWPQESPLWDHGWTWSNPHTTMKSGCNTGQAELRIEDKNDINTWYD